MNPDAVLLQLKALADPSRLSGMARFGIVTGRALGVSVPHLRRTAKELKQQRPDRHGLALGLWETGVHEARILASMVEDPALCEQAQMEAWVADFNSWDLCDQCCLNLFALTARARDKALAWSGRREEFVKRAGFALMACLAVKDKNGPDSAFAPFFPALERECTDPRNYVKKAVNWALRQMGKRSPGLNRAAREAAERMATKDSPAARWIARDALRELTDPAVCARIKR